MVRLHPRHGLNPTIPTCFWCGEDRGEVALLGSAYKGEAPMHMVIDYEPCDNCREQWEQGVVVVEADEKPVHENQPPMTGGKRTMETAYGPRDLDIEVYPTGRVVVVTREGIRKLFLEPYAQQVLDAGRCFLESDGFERLFGGATVGGVS